MPESVSLKLMCLVSDGAKGSVVVDDRYFPLIVSSFVGEVELPQARWFEDVTLKLVRRGVTEGVHLVNIHDASRSTRTSPEMRKFWADLSRRHEDGPMSTQLTSFIVVSSPIIRGVMTAVGWLNPKVAQLQVFPTLQEALLEATSELIRRGSPASLPTEGYRPPAKLEVAGR